MAQHQFERAREALKRLINKGEITHIEATAFLFHGLKGEAMPENICERATEVELDQMVAKVRPKYRVELTLMAQEGWEANDEDDEEAA